MAGTPAAGSRQGGNPAAGNPAAGNPAADRRLSGILQAGNLHVHNRKQQESQSSEN